MWSDKLMWDVFRAPGEIDPDLRPPWQEGPEREMLLAEAMSTLGEREQRVLTVLYGLEGIECRTLWQASEEIGYKSKTHHAAVARVCQTRAKALRKLRHPSRSKKLRGYMPLGVDIRLAIAKTELYAKLSQIYPKKVALTVARQVRLEDMRQALGSTEAAIRSSCGRQVSHCVNCGKPLPPAWNFCDAHCRALYNIITVVCDGCGQPFPRHTYQLWARKKGEKYGKTRNYCCRACLWHRDGTGEPCPACGRKKIIREASSV